MFQVYKTFLVLFLVLVLASACSNKENSSLEQHQLSNGDLQEITKSIDILPSFLSTQPEEIRSIYQLAGKNTDLLQWIPCYCGCAESAGHRSNMNCFIAEVLEDGSLKWDDHGTRCGVCLEIAVESARLSKDGVSVKDIRKQIDEKYKTGYAQPTPTPLPI